jgi:hypothetical protein
MPLDKEKRKAYMKLYNKEYKLKNPDKINEIQKRYYHKFKNDPIFAERQRVNRKKTKLLKRYGINQEHYDAMFVNQNGCCAICETKSEKLESICKYGSLKLGVDHCHATKKIRGLLCSRCNHGLGLFKDSVEYLKKAIEYLSRSRFLPANKNKPTGEK